MCVCVCNLTRAHVCVCVQLWVGCYVYFMPKLLAFFTRRQITNDFASQFADGGDVNANMSLGMLLNRCLTFIKVVNYSNLPKIYIDNYVYCYPQLKINFLIDFDFI